MEKGDKGSTLTRMGVSWWMFFLVPAYPGCPWQTAVKWLFCCLRTFVQHMSIGLIWYWTVSTGNWTESKFVCLRHHHPVTIAFRLCAYVILLAYLPWILVLSGFRPLLCVDIWSGIMMSTRLFWSQLTLNRPSTVARMIHWWRWSSCLSGHCSLLHSLEFTRRYHSSVVVNYMCKWIIMSNYSKLFT